VTSVGENSEVQHDVEGLSPAEYDLVNQWEPLDHSHDLAPAYRAIAALLGDGQWHTWWRIWDTMAAAVPGHSETEYKAFFSKTVRQGWITQGNQKGPSPQFRVTRVGLIERPELRGREGQFSTPSLWRELRAQVDWLNDPRSERPHPAPEQPRPEPKQVKAKAASAAAPTPVALPTVPTVATIVAAEGQLHPSLSCRCGNRLVFRLGKVPPKGDRWQCPLYQRRGGVDDPNHDRQWANA
jgi:hypothetical protein